MPKSRSRRTRSQPPPRRKPPRSPKWVPRLGLGLIFGGVALIVVSFVFELPGGGIDLLLGFALMAGGLIALSYYR
ncbi:hypothetical protein ER308_10750 [Egibacter rhizosphaerae]|uniref:Cell division protein CrgA n=1 Tax=Egibacter rhizosphaerae TaxID=1670831 RepID=A0A411YFI5_9ACTN|nr:hypothetical protein ER308_10750 [Egibacter rhizosphaerae]